MLSNILLDNIGQHMAHLLTKNLMCLDRGDLFGYRIRPQFCESCTRRHLLCVSWVRVFRLNVRKRCYFIHKVKN